MSGRIGAERLRAALRLVAVTPDGANTPEEAVRLIAPALRGGATMLQYRDKRDIAPELRARMAAAIRAACAESGAMFIVNDDLSLARLVGADGVHLGPEDERVDVARSRVPEGFIIGASAGTTAAAHSAASRGADYLGVGAIFDARATKANASEPRGVEHLRAVRAALPRMPLVGIGGITEQNASSVTGSGADGVAVVRAVFVGADPAGAARVLRERVLLGLLGGARD
ncbi:MAG: thiamine-phosphate pyrophosphorylase [Bradymonadia bacterium]